MTYWRLFYHLVWATKGRMPIIDPDREAVIQRIFVAVCQDEGAVVHAVGIVPDHVHLAVSIPPSRTVSDIVRRLKSASSRAVNDQRRQHDGTFGWQGEYGVLSFGERSLATVVAYVANQHSHHAENDLLPSYELTDNPGR